MYIHQTLISTAREGADWRKAVSQRLSAVLQSAESSLFKLSNFLKNYFVLRLEEQLSVQEHLLLFQRAWVQLSEPT